MVRQRGLAAVLVFCLARIAAAGFGGPPEQLHPDVVSPFPSIDFSAEQELSEDYHATMRAFVQRFEEQQLQLARQKGSMQTENKSVLLERLIGNHDKNSCGIDERSRPTRDYLVVLPAGDEFDASKWMDDPKRSNWDIIVIYYGKNPYYRCPLCKAVYRASGAKWRLVWGFTLLPEWQEYRQRYSAVMFADDDLGLNMCAINTLFSVIKAYKLFAAQPSLCNVHRSFTLWQPLYQHPENVLRYTTMTEIMASTFDMDYFQNFIRPSLYNAWVGWGLDFVWPFLLKYPRDKIAVVDQVCMFHPPSAPGKRNSVYSAASPFRKKEEETRRFAEYGYFASEIEKLGFHHMPVEIVGVVPKPGEVAEQRYDIGSSHSPPHLTANGKVVPSRCGLDRLFGVLPLLLLVQSGIIMFVGLYVLRSKAWAQWHQRLGARWGNGSKSAVGFGITRRMPKGFDLIPAKF